MTNIARRAAALSLAAVVAGLVLVASPAAATPNCIAQSAQAEHELYGSSWGKDLVAFLASHPEALQEFGFRHFGAFAKFAASQDPTACPADL